MKDYIVDYEEIVEGSKADIEAEKKYYIMIKFYNPCSHSYDWCIVGADGWDTLSEELAMLFNSKEEACEWLQSEEGQKWKPCEFLIKRITA